MGRTACFMVIDFPLASIVRINPALREVAFALGLGQGPRAEIVNVSANARRFGVTAGMTAAQATAILPDLTIINHSRASEQAARDALLDAAESLSPVVEDGGAGSVFADLAGMAGLFGTEREFAEEAVRRIRSIGLEASVGISSSKEIARLAAQCGGIRIIDPGREREFLNWIPVELVNPQPEFETLLSRWGIRRLGDLAALNPAEIGTRLGGQGVDLVRLARGEISSAVVARPHTETFVEKIELEYGIELLEPLMFLIRGLLERLAARLTLRGLIAGDLTLSLELAERGRDERRVTVSAPTNEIRPLLALIRGSLEKAPPPQAISAIQIAADPKRPRPSQNDFFLPPAPAPEKLQATLMRLAALCGSEQVGHLKAEDNYRPEAIEVAVFAPPPPCPSVRSGQSDTGCARIVLRSIRPAEEIEVLCNRGEPEFIRGRSICARVVSIAGPWRRQGEWWNQRSFARDYYDLALADGGVYRAFCDLQSARWFVDGIYD